MTEETLDEKVREQLVKDYKQVQQIIEQRVLNKTPNFSILKENYLNPELSTSEVPSFELNGELKYFCRVRIVLEFALSNNYIPKDTILPKGSPEYLKGLVK